DLNIDSLGWVSVSLELESRLGISLPEATVERLATARDLLQAVRDAEPGEGAQPAPDLGAWLAERPWPLRAVAELLHGLNALLMALLFRFEAQGREHLPDDAPFLIVANHASDLDPSVVAAALTPRLRRRLTWSGNRKRLFRGPLTRLFSRIFRVLPVDERDARNVLESGKAVLAAGEGLVWFPESWRTPDGHLQRFLPGVGEIVQGLDLPIVPVYLDGTFEAWPRDRARPRLAKVTAHIGRPVRAAELAGRGEGQDVAERIADALRREVAALAPGGAAPSA
ncbi:MAG: 1-acyl-sn-glycerol-3-phosphate acyltransferase, partial [Tistlia sp.]